MALAEDAGWTKAQLMGGSDVPPPGKKGKEVKGKGVDKDPLLWGRPGHLTSDEADTFERFRAEIEKRGEDFRQAVYCFGEEEGEVYALSRWLRARKYVYDDVIAMIEKAVEMRLSGKENDFYPDPHEALGCDPSLFYAQYPQLYSGVAKNGAPLFISKPGLLNIDAIGQITTLDGIIKFHWFLMVHDFAARLREQKVQNPSTFKRFECLSILDLDGLTMSQLNRKTLAVVKEESAINSDCFPETMYKMIIVNAPTFFSATWRLIKGWLDPRTQAKIEVISSRAAGEKRLRELVDIDQLPSDYGGKGPDTTKTLEESHEGDEDRLDTRMVYLRGSGSEVVDVPSDQSLQVTIFTRSMYGAKIWITNAKTKAVVSEAVEVVHTGQPNNSDGEPVGPPTRTIINQEKIVGPTSIKIKAESHAGRFTSENYLFGLSYFYKNSTKAAKKAAAAQAAVNGEQKEESPEAENIEVVTGGEGEEPKVVEAEIQSNGEVVEANGVSKAPTEQVVEETPVITAAE